VPPDPLHHLGITPNKTYGSLGAVVGLMTWLWLSSIVILLGAELDAETEHQTARDTTTGSPVAVTTHMIGVLHACGSAESGLADVPLKSPIRPERPNSAAMAIGACLVIVRHVLGLSHPSAKSHDKGNKVMRVSLAIRSAGQTSSIPKRRSVVVVYRAVVRAI
jgi:Virulence factor BrkB